MESTTTELRLADAYDSRCHGLVGGYAYKADLQTLAKAEYVRREHGPFYCRECLSEAIVRKCSDKDDHFAHKALVSPTAKRGNTVFHHGVRDELCTLLQAAFPAGCWQTERDIKDKAGLIFRADVAGYFGERGQGIPPVAIEVQLSPYSPRYIRQKTAFYAKQKVHVLWLVPLTRELEQKTFRPRRYELYLHSLGLGYVCYYEPGHPGEVTPVHFGPAMRYIEETTFFGPGGVEEQAGGYYLKYKTLKTPCFTAGRRVQLTDLVAKSLAAWENPNNKRLSLPARKIIGVGFPKWWPDDERKQWLKDNDWLAYVRRYLSNYQPDDEQGVYPDWEEE